MQCLAVHKLSLGAGVSRSIFLRACTEISEASSNKHGCLDQLSNKRLVRLLRHRRRRGDDRRGTYRSKDVLRNAADVANFCVIWPVAGTHC